MGKADLKKMRSQLMDEFPQLTKKMLDKVLPVKDSVNVNVLKCSNGTQLFVAGDSPPAFFDDGFGGVYPTLFTMWQLPNMMPQLVTHGPVSKFLIPKVRPRDQPARRRMPAIFRLHPHSRSSSFPQSDGQR